MDAQSSKVDTVIVNQRTHVELDRLCTQERINRVLLGIRPDHRLLIICIVRQNILSGRVAALMRIEHVKNDADWMNDYVARIAAHFARERSRWQGLQDPKRLGRVVGLIRHATALQMSMLNARFGNVGWNVEDIAQEMLYSLSTGLLLRYPFDVRLWQWIQSRIQICALDLYELSPKHRKRRDAEVPIDQLDRAEYAVLVQNLNRLGRIDDNYVALAQASAKLSTEHQLVLEHLLHDVPIDETAALLGLAPKTVYARRQTVMKQLRLMLN